MACAGRNPVLVEKKQTSDPSLNCDELRAEIDSCTKIILEKHHAGKKKMEETVGAAVVGYVIFPPILLAMDLKKADYKEMGSYMERRDHLFLLAKDKGCSWCDQTESNDELMARAAAEYAVLKAKRDQEAMNKESNRRY